jgi:hypothetical protein
MESGYGEKTESGSIILNRHRGCRLGDSVRTLRGERRCLGGWALCGATKALDGTCHQKFACRSVKANTLENVESSGEGVLDRRGGVSEGAGHGTFSSQMINGLGLFRLNKGVDRFWVGEIQRSYGDPIGYSKPVEVMRCKRTERPRDAGDLMATLEE